MIFPDFPIENYMVMRQVLLTNIDEELFPDESSPLTEYGVALRAHILSRDSVTMIESVRTNFGEEAAYSIMYPKYKITVKGGEE